MKNKLLSLVPSELWDANGSIFYSGSKAYEGKKPLYILGLNPGGTIEDHIDQTLKHHTGKLIDKILWSEYQDETWNKKEAGKAPHQKRVLHLLKQLDLNPQLIPASNLVFIRTQSEDKLKDRFYELAESCWPFHKYVIENLEIKNIICFGKRAGGYLCTKLKAYKSIGIFEEKNKRKWKTEIFENKVGIKVIVATHPSRADWTNPKADPSELIKRTLYPTNGIQ